MRVTTSRAVLAGIWFGSFTASVAMVVTLRSTGQLHAEWFWLGLRTLSSAYAPYLVAVGLFYWKHDPAGRQRRSRSATGETLALGSSVMWNGIVLFALVPLLFQRDDIETAIQTISLVGSTLSWLVAASIGYYFVAPAKES